MRTQPITFALLTLAVAGAVTACSGAATTAPPPAQAPAAGSPGPANPPADVPRCATGRLSVSLGDGGAAAGSVYRPLIFVNTGRDACELRGFPGVSYIAGDPGQQVGPAAAWSGERGEQIVMAPGGTAMAQLQLVNVQNFDAAVCRPTPVRGLRVYPPDDAASLFVPVDGTGCAGTPPGPQLSVQAVQAP